MKKVFDRFISFCSFHAGIVKDLIRLDKAAAYTIIFISIIHPFSNLVELKFMEYIVNEVAYRDFSNEKSFAYAVFLVCAMAILLLIFKGMGWLFNKVYNRFSKKIITIKRRDFLSQISKIQYEFFEDADFHNRMFIANQGPEKYAVAISHVSELIYYIINTLIYMVMLSQIHAGLIFSMMAVFFIYLLINKNNLAKWDYYYEDKVIPEQRKSSYFENILGSRVNHSTIQINRQLPYFTDKYEKHADLERKYTLKMNFLSFATELKMSLPFFALMSAVLIIVADGIVHGTYTIGRYTVMCSLLFRVFSLCRNITQYIYSDKEHVKCIKEYQNIMKLPDCPDNTSDETNNIVYARNLKYKYMQAQDYALKNITCQFKQGEKIAIVGKNGSGKSTFMSLLLGLLSKSEGELENTIGKPAAIMQDFQFYQMTIKENIELGCGGKKLSESEIIDILKEVRLYDDIKKLPDGIYTQLGQINNGVELSKGQFQKLALARMLAKNDAEIWILDEPTAYLDPISEIKMYDHILSLSGDRLVFFISHRLGFAKKADKIIVLEDGKIFEAGTHEELMNIDEGIYQQMYYSQLKWYE